MKFIFFLIVFGYLFYLFRTYDTDKFNKIDRKKARRFEGDLSEHEAGLLVALLAKVAKADGRVCELEAELLKHTFEDIAVNFINKDEVKEELKKIYKREKEHFENTIIISKKLLKLTKNYQRRLKILEYLLNMAFIDKNFSDTEFMIIEDIATALEIQKSDLESLINRFKEFYANKEGFEVKNIQKAYEILNSSKEDDFSVIKKRYRELVKKHHPDIVKGEGASEDIIKQATIKLQEINEAYELIKKDKGIIKK